ncbi:MAG: AraC family transcriptional regulator [Oliverpabstia sp.]|nr:AraC family transcriptional regulator [Oliverpabstia sp.]
MCLSPYELTYNDLNPRFLFSCLLERQEEEQNYHCHDFIEIVIILKGKGHFLINGTDIPITEGNVLLLNPGTYHKSIPLPSHTLTECYLAFTDVEFINTPKNFFPLFHGQKILGKLPEKAKKEIFQLCSAMNQESQSRNTGRYFMLKAYLIQVLCLLLRFDQQEELSDEHHMKGYEFKSPNKTYVVQQIMKYMESHYREKISLDQIAENMYLSPFYISKLFKSETGDTPINYLISLRMEKAKELLDRNPSLSIQEAAAQVGYEDAYHFSKLFKKYFGLSPMYYKARIEK